MKAISIYIFFFGLSFMVVGQDSVLQQYINIGLESNLALKQKKSSYEKSIEALNQARAYYLPEISLNARYTIANGGRVIDFPVGDMLNPVYSTLNYLTSTEAFPQIENQTYQFYRPHEQETKMELIQPLINPAIGYNYKINKELLKASNADLNAFRRQLVGDIKSAYYSYQKTVRLQHLVKETRTLLEENIRVNNSLYRNDKVTVDVVYRSEAELSKLEQNEAIIMKNNKMAASWMNFLLNQAFDTEIKTLDNIDLLMGLISLENAEELAFVNREELDQMDYYMKAGEYKLKLNVANGYPTVFAAVNYGIQGTNYSFTKDDDFFLGSLVLRWNIFKGLENKSKIKQAKIELDQIVTRKSQISDNIRLEVTEAYYSLEAAAKYVQAVQKEKESSTKAFNVISKKYGEGMVNLVEFMDSRTTMTTAMANFIIARFEYKIMEAEFERVIGTYILPLEANDNINFK
ncbi:MAG: TolC family protein [Bacteroidales bacterium]|nr:TolC family protein [Bacteroidales bacterium]